MSDREAGPRATEARVRPDLRARAPGDAARDTEAAPRTAVFVIVALAALLVVLATQYGGALRIPFINDDFVFLDRVRGASLPSLVGFDHLAFGWYRPWSRELHYAWLSRAFGEHEAPFHVASLALWLALMTGYGLLVRWVAGTRVAAIAVAGAAAMSAWAVPLLWTAGVQELWMLLWAVLALHVFARGRVGWAAATFALALLSKETAAVLPGVMLAQARWVDRATWSGAVRRVAPSAVVLLAWLCLHPLAGGRLWHAPAPRHPVAATTPARQGALFSAGGEQGRDRSTASAPRDEGPSVGAPSSLVERAARSALALMNLDRWPRPESGWARAAGRAVPAALALAALVVWVGVRTRSSRGGTANPGGIVKFGLVWTVLGWLPLAMPGLGWHSYYGLLGLLGGWLALGVVLARAPVLAVAAVIATCVLRAAVADTPSRDWGAEWYQRRAGAFLDYMKRDLGRLHPTLPHGARLFFLSVPSNVGFLTKTGPSLRVWYRDSTLWGGYFSDYMKRPAGRPGPDFFFRYDSTAGWRELRPGNEDVARAARANPSWSGDVRELAAAFAHAGDWAQAASQYEKLSRAAPNLAEPALDAGVAHAMAGDTVAALAWFRAAGDRPAATPGQREQARAYARELRGLGGERSGR